MIISTEPHNGVLTRKYPNEPWLLRVVPWYFKTILDLSRLFSTPWYTE